MLTRSLLNGTLETAIDFFAKIGISIDPYYIYREEISDRSIQHIEKGFEEYSIQRLEPQHMKIIVSMRPRFYSKKKLKRKLKKGNICLGVKHGDELVAYSWYSLSKSNIKGKKTKLENNEAYLFDMYTMPSYRGNGIAPYLRYQAYRELKKLGRKKLYSYTDYFNTPAMRFKEKLNAKKTELCLKLSFRRWSINKRLKKYS
jgi:hypothetical protein